MRVKLTHMLDVEQELQLTVQSDFLVRELKELIVLELGHGKARQIILSATGDNAGGLEACLGLEALDFRPSSSSLHGK